jgi:hypothetical protein
VNNVSSGPSALFNINSIRIPERSVNEDEDEKETIWRY